MLQDELLRSAVAALEQLDLRYFVTGSLATILYGEPRFTNDIDLVVAIDVQRVERLCQAFAAPEYYVSPESARAAIARHGQFNVLQPASGLKLDIIVPAPTPFNRSRFERARRVQVAAGHEVFFASPEDVILKKMEFYRDGGSDKHLRDVTGVLKVSGGEVDRGYVAAWAARLGVADIWREVELRAPT
jgi:hypothetical protein